MGKYNNRNFGFSLAEVVVSMTVLAIFLAVSAPMIVKHILFTGMQPTAVKCVVDDLGSNVAVNCIEVVDKSKTDKGSYLSTVMSFAENGTAIQQDSALKVVEETCSNGGTDSCEYLIRKCINNNDNCNVADKTYDIYNYLQMPANSDNAGKLYMYQRLKELLADELSFNFYTYIESACNADNASMACKLINQKTYDFNLWDREDYTEEDPEIRTKLVNGSVVLDITTRPPSSWMYAFKIDGVTKDDLFNDLYIDDSNQIHVVGGIGTASYASGTLYYQFDPAGNVLETFTLGQYSNESGYVYIDESDNIIIVQNADDGLHYVKVNEAADTIMTEKSISSGGTNITPKQNDNKLFYQDDGSFYIITQDHSLTKFNSDLSFAWTKDIGDGFIDRLESLTIDESGNIYILFTHGVHLSLAKLNPSATTVDWAYNEPYDSFSSEPRDIILVNNYLYAVSRTEDGRDLALFVKIDPSDGSLVYQAGFEYPFGYDHWNLRSKRIFYDIDDEGEGYFYLAAEVEAGVPDPNDIVIFKLKEEGTTISIQWSIQFGDKDYDEFVNDIYVKNGMVVIVGMMEVSAGHKDAFIACFSDEQTSNITGFTIIYPTAAWESDIKSSLSISDDGTHEFVNDSDFSLGVDVVTGRSLEAGSYGDFMGVETSTDSTVEGYITTNTNNITDISNKIISATFTETKPTDTEIYYLVTFDGGTTWKYYDSDLGSWQTATVTSLDSYDFSADNSSTSGDLVTGLPLYDFASEGDSGFGFVADLQSSHETNVPSLDEIVINYL